MYRDEQEALEARRDSLARETVEVNTRLKAIDDLNRMKPIAPRWQYISGIGACLTVLISFAGMWGMIVFFSYTSSNPELAPDSDASACEEHGVPALRPESDPNGEVCEFDPDCRSGYVCVEGRCSFSIPEYCDGMDNDCDTGDSDSYDVVFLFDTSQSMEAHLDYLKEAVMSYARETGVTYTLAETLPGTGYGRMVEYRDRDKFVSAVSRIGVNPRVDNESIPLLLDEWTIFRTNIGGKALVFAFTDEAPQIPDDYYYQLYGNGLRPWNFCSPRYNRVTFTVFTTPQNIAAWEELGSCIRVYGEL